MELSFQSGTYLSQSLRSYFNLESPFLIIFVHIFCLQVIILVRKLYLVWKSSFQLRSHFNQEIIIFTWKLTFLVTGREFLSSACEQKYVSPAVKLFFCGCRGFSFKGLHIYIPSKTKLNYSPVSNYLVFVKVVVTSIALCACCNSQCLVFSLV